jgi:cytochrome c biogenesis protein CcmG/thiol:disulfide interchange protein DsbE
VSPTENTKNNRPLIFGAGLIVILALIAFFATRSDDSGSGTEGSGSDGGEDVEQIRPVTVDGQPLPPFDRDAPGGDPAVGQTAPTIKGAAFDGSEISIAPGSNPKLVIWVAHWCPHCQREVPRIVEWLKESGTPEGLDLIVVATDVDPNRPNYPPSEWLEREGLDLPTMADDAKLSSTDAMGLTAYPFFVLLDPDNKVLARDGGELTSEQLDGLVELAGT